MSRSGFAALAALCLFGCHDAPLDPNRQLKPPSTPPQIRAVKRTACISASSEAISVCEVVVFAVSNHARAQCYTPVDGAWKAVGPIQGSFTHPLRCVGGGMDFDESLLFDRSHDLSAFDGDYARIRPSRLGGRLHFVGEIYERIQGVTRALSPVDPPGRYRFGSEQVPTESVLLVAGPGPSDSELEWNHVRWERSTSTFRPGVLPGISAANLSGVLFVQPSFRLFYVSREQRLIAASLANDVWTWVDVGVADLVQVEAVKLDSQFVVAWALADGTVEFGVDDGKTVQRVASLGQRPGAFALAATDSGIALVLRESDGTLFLQMADLSGKLGAQERIPTDGATQPGIVMRQGVPTVSFVEDTADGPVTVVAEKGSGGWVRTVLHDPTLTATE